MFRFKRKYVSTGPDKFVTYASSFQILYNSGISCYNDNVRMRYGKGFKKFVYVLKRKKGKMEKKKRNKEEM